MKTVLRKHGFPGAVLVCATVFGLALFAGGCSQPAGAPPPVRFTLSFEGHGGPVADPITAEEGAAVPKPADPVREGYVFQGWFDTETGGTLYTWPHILTADTTMHARWLPQAAADFKEDEAVKEALETDAGDIDLSLSAEDLATVEARIEEALEAYEGLPEAAKAALAEEKAKLDGVKETIGHVNTARTFRESHGETLGTDPAAVESAADAAALLPGLEEALAELDALPEPVKDLLKEEIARLEALREKAEAVAAGNATEADRAAAAGFREAHGGILGKTAETVEPGDGAALDAALTAYGDLEPAVRALLLEEYRLLTGFKAQLDTWAYTIRYQLNGGSNNGANPGSYRAADLPVRLTDPVRAGYDFGGWYDTADLSGTAVTEIPAGGTGDRVFYARWTVTVSFDVRSGSPVPEVQTVTEGGKATAPEPPARDGLSFGGWYSDRGLTALYDFNSPLTASRTLYARWTATVSFNADGGSPAPGAQTVAEGDKAAAPEPPARDDLSFGGWYSDRDLTSTYDFDSPVTGHLTLYAAWGYTVNFRTGGGRQIASQTVVAGRKAAVPAAPAGGNLEGWYTDSGLTTTYDFNSPVTGPLTLYARWTATVHFDTKGGSVITPQTVQEGGTAAEPVAPTRAGLDFGGWYTDSDLTSAYDFDSVVTGHLTLYARWTATVHFDLQSGTPPAPADQTVAEEGKAAKPEDPVKSDYAFAGWYTSVDLTTRYDFNSPVTGHLTLYAGWGYTVTFNAQGGSPVASQAVPADRSAEEPADPIKANLDFEGWYSDSGLTTPYDFDSTTVTGSLILYARWTATVNFDTKGGSVIAPQTVQEGGTAAEPVAPTRAGYTFADWYGDSNFTTPYNFDTTVTGHRTLYAGWLSGLGVTIRVNEDGAILVSGSNLTIAKTGDGDRSFTATVKDGYSGVQWYLNGSPLSGSRGTAQSVSIRAADYRPGTYLLGVTVIKGGTPYSTELRFTVIN